MSVYGIFDQFLAADTWSSNHDLDNARFYKALSQVVSNPDYNPDQMGRYLRDRFPNGYEHAIDRLVSNAWAVKDYLAATT